MISTSALHHWDEENKLKLYKMVFDSLNNAGTFVNSDKIVDTQAEQDEWLGYWNNSPEMMAHIDTPLTPENEVKLLKAAGFVSVTVYPAPKDDSIKVKVVDEKNAEKLLNFDKEGIPISAKVPEKNTVYF